MAHTDAHTPFKFSDYSKAVNDDTYGRPYHVLTGVDYTEHENLWQKDRNRFRKSNVQQDTERRRTKSSRRANRQIMHNICRDPELFDSTIFHTDRTDVYDWN